MDYISVKTAAQKFGVTPRWIQKLCTEGKIEGAVRLDENGVWLIPKDVQLVFERKNKRELHESELER